MKPDNGTRVWTADGGDRLSEGPQGLENSKEIQGGEDEWIAIVIRLQKKGNIQVPDMFSCVFHLLLNKLS